MEMEAKNIDYITPEERYGKTWHIGFVWFGAMNSVVTVSLGFISVMLGLSFGWALLAIILGHAIGGLFMAGHSVQGPHLGIPQMIQSRAQFGVLGAAIPLLIVAVMYWGYMVACSAFLEQTVATIDAKLPSIPVILFFNFITLVIGIFGYKMIHYAYRYLTVMGIIMFGAVFIGASVIFPSGELSNFSSVHLGIFLLALSINATIQVSSAPYVADYSRYLPVSTKSRDTFIWTYGPSVLSGIFTSAIGAMLAIEFPQGGNDLVNTCAHVVPFTLLFLIIQVTMLCLGATMNIYASFMSLTTIFERTYLLKKFSPKGWRILVMFLLFMTSSIAASVSSEHLLIILNSFLSLVMFTLIPWTSINLVDYYFIRKGKYRIDDIFSSNGIYGKWNISTISIYIMTIVIQIPFMNVDIYTGFIAKMTGGSDVSWLVGGIFSAIGYYMVNHKKCESADVLSPFETQEIKQ